MIATDEIRSALPTALVDLRDVPLAEMPALSESLLRMALERVMPDTSAYSVPVSAFQSAI
jgi:FXSXX-COOH protein